jgi:alkylation response protein AidB-like acyl-CoA dehydrogenase
VSDGLDLGFDDAQQAIADALAQFCAERCDDDTVKSLENRFPTELWAELAELGVLALLTPEGDGGAVELVAACESLGRAVFPGPLAATFLATRLLPEAERQKVASGGAIVSVGSDGLMPWAPHADVFIELAGGRAWLARASGPVEAVETLGGEPWGRVRLERTGDLGPIADAVCVHDIALSAYVAAAGRRLVEDTAAHARDRKQFGRAIGEFQAVAHPLADCVIALDAAATLARGAAWRLDSGEPGGARSLASAARLASVRAGVETAHTCHQLFGAVGITLEGPVFHVARRIRQLASQPPGDGGARATLLADLEL